MGSIELQRAYQEQFRPQVFSGMVGLQKIERQFRSITEEGRLNALLITGFFGSGKSTVAKHILMRTFCQNPSGTDACLKCHCCLDIQDAEGISDCLFTSGDKLNAEFLRYVDMKHFFFVPAVLPARCLFIDDIDFAERAIQEKLIGILNRWPHNPVVLTASCPDRIPEPVRNRCKTIQIRTYEMGDLVALVNRTCERSHIEILDVECVQALVRLTNLNPRKILNVLEVIKGEGIVLDREALNLPLIQDNF